MSPVRVLIADEQALVRSGFRMIIEARDDLEVGEAEDATRRRGSPTSPSPTSC
jgi:DNA-binding NarL/FixJ family response regulator